MKGPCAIEELESIISYDLDAGLMWWKHRDDALLPHENFAKAWNRKFAGGPALHTLLSNGYRYGSIFKTKVYAHRVIMALANGRWPEGQIDHINGVRDDNRLLNLREVDQPTNSRNQKIKCTNKSGVTGVCYIRRISKWRAEIMVGGQAIFLGVFHDKDAAVAARMEANKVYGFHANHGRR